MSSGESATTKSMMPTGEEPPKGFENLYAERKKRESVEPGTINIDAVSVSQLAGIEVKEMEVMRNRALDYFLETTGEPPTLEGLEEELRRTPEGKTKSDRLIFRAYSGSFMVGYAQVLCGWPEKDEWTVEQLLLDPSFRLKGIGSQIISKVEELAELAKVRATSIIAIPQRKGADRFWEFVGYEHEQDGPIELQAKDLGREVIVLRKTLH